MSENVHFRSTTRHMLRESQSYVNQTLMGGLSGFESPIGLDRRNRINALKSGEVDVLSPVNATLAKSLDTNTYQASAADGSDK